VTEQGFHPAYPTLASWRDATLHEDRPSRPRALTEGGQVALREVTGETVREICRLVVKRGQEGFVAPNAVSIAEAHFSPAAWFRAIYADDTPVGFVMLEREPATHEYMLWRFMIAGDHQGMGYGRRALELVVDDIRAADPAATELLTSWMPGDGSPEGFYVGFGFVPTGEVDEDELVGRLELQPGGTG
jgi:diamine N-acetyltransferase